MPLPETFAEDITLFRGQSQKQPHGRVFGGQVLAQGVVACGRTVRAVEGGADRRLHSIHAYFMRPATTPSRSPSASSGCATAGRSRPAGCTPSSTASRSCR